MAWPPFNYAENGKPLGFSIDYMDLIAKKTGLKVKYVTGPTWNEFLQMMKDGSLDVMLNIVKTPEREKFLLYTPPYADNPNAIVSKKGVAYQSIESLFGKLVAVPKGFFTEEVLKKHYPQIRLYPVRNTLEAMKAVSFGKADAALGESAVLHHLIAAHMLSDLMISGEANRSNRYPSKFGVIMLDIDNFKRVNDVHGHQIGDKILQEFADILKSHSRKSDIVGRWGGEEFLIICCETCEEGMLAFAENLREKIATYPFTLGEQKTASLGLSLYQKGEDIKDLVKRADSALYKAKEKGRNRVELL